MNKLLTGIKGQEKMSANPRVVHIGDVAVSNDPNDVLVAYGLGSCVVVCLYDSVAKVGGMVHALLPTAPNGRYAGNPAKYVDQAVPLLVDDVMKMGARRIWTVAKMCGGAQLILGNNRLDGSGFNGHLSIGQRNVQAAKAALHSAGLRLVAWSTGGQAGRTVRFYLANGKVTVKTLGHGERVLV